MATEAKPYAQGSELGKTTEYPQKYTPDVLFSIPRQDSRSNLLINCSNLLINNEPLPFAGVDRWMAWEVSWLNDRGVPQVAMGHFEFDCMSSHIVESKSFKLYLNSLNQTRFSDWPTVEDIVERDLSHASGAPVKVSLIKLHEVANRGVSVLSGESLDDLPITVESDDYRYQPEVLTLASSSSVIEETLTSDLLRSNCPVTGQPDWGSIWIHYIGQKIDRAGLLKYIIALRQQQDFHEQCVETLYVDLMRYCQPEKLSVYACYTRRGGLDINPFRSNFESIPSDIFRLARQ